MLSGLEITELKLSELERGIRIDSELYQKKFIHFFNKLQNLNVTTLDNEAQIIKKGIFDIKSNCYSDKGIPFVRISNLKNMLIETSDIVYIPESENEKNLDTFLKKDDLILSKTAYPAASLVNLDACNTSQDTVAIQLKSNSNLLSHFIVTYLNTSYGLGLMKRWFTGNIQMHLNLEDCKKNLLIPVFSIKFQKKIKELFEESANLKTESQTLYKQSETLLLRELGLDNWQPPKETAAVKSFSDSFGKSGRLDAEYYQPKYDEIENVVANKALYLKQISEIQIFNGRGLQPEYVENGGLNVINSRHISEQQLDYENFEKTDISYWISQKRARVFKNDILVYTTGANIGRTNVYLIEEKAIASNHVNIIRIKDENPGYVGFVLNSIIGRLQTEKFSAGSAQQELYPRDLENFFVPFVDKKIQAEITKKIQESFALRTESQRLLELAKKAVETAIEHGEEKAMKLIDERSKS